MSTCILIPSCDKYSFLWNTQAELLSTIPEFTNFKIYLSSAFQASRAPSNFIPLTVDNNSSWSLNMLQALELIEETNILILLDDLILSKTSLNADYLFLLINLFEKGYIDYLGLTSFTDKTGINSYKKDYISLRRIPTWSAYRCSLYPGLWKKTTLLSILKSTSSAWDFERSGTLYSKCYRNWYRVEQTVFGAKNIVIKGLVVRNLLHLLNNSKISLKCMSKIEYLKFSIYNKLYHIYIYIYYGLIEKFLSRDNILISYSKNR